MALLATPSPTYYKPLIGVGRITLNAMWISTDAAAAYETTTHDPDNATPSINADILTGNKLKNPILTFVDHQGARVPQITFEYQAGFNDPWLKKLIAIMADDFDFESNPLPMAVRFDQGGGFELRGEGQLTSELRFTNSSYSRQVSMTWLMPYWNFEDESTAYIRAWFAYASSQGISRADFESWLTGSLNLPIMANTTAYVDSSGGIYLDTDGDPYYAAS